jgi:hypothetical protein
MNHLALSHTVYNVVWAYGTIVMLSVFAVFEFMAFFDRKPNEDTYSAHVWKWIGTRRGWTGWHIPLRLAMLIFLLWLAEHFTFGWF